MKSFYGSFGFSLSEVLITLGVIGVVAGLTLPTIVTNIQKKIISGQLKTTYSLLYQSIEKSGCSIEDPEWVNNIGNKTPDLNFERNLLKQCIIGNLKITKDYGRIYPPSYGFKKYYDVNKNQVAPTTTTGTVFHTIKLANGSYIFSRFITSSSGKYSGRIRIYIDVNGDKGPNIYGKDLFLFYIDQKGRPYIPGYRLKREVILQNCSQTTINYNETFCSALIQHDNWEIKDDYPW